MRTLRLAIEGCYPAFPQSDLVMRALGVLCRYELVPRWRPHDLLIRGPFSEGSGRRRLVNRGLRTQRSLLRWPVVPSLHVSSENPFAANYQSFEESGCNFGLGHELRVGDATYFRLPHWLNYLDFTAQGIPSPSSWVRLGAPIQQEQLLRPLAWNREADQKAVFVASYLNAERHFLMRQASQAVPIDGFGRAFDRAIPDHTRSSFTKRELLAGYQYNFCPENAIAPGYVTEKIPESFACGCIPIAYVDPTVSVDFSLAAFVNLHDFLAAGVAVGLEEALANAERRTQLLATPLLRAPFEVEALISFLERVLAESRAG